MSVHPSPEPRCTMPAMAPGSAASSGSAEKVRFQSARRMITGALQKYAWAEFVEHYMSRLLVIPSTVWCNPLAFFLQASIR